MDPGCPEVVRQRSPGDDAYLSIVPAVGQFGKRRRHSVSLEIGANNQTGLATE